MKSLRSVVLMLGLLLAACGGKEIPQSSGIGPGDYFLAANLWYENPMKISKYNFHVGYFLRAGTKCRVTGVDTRALEFQTEDGKEFRIVSSRHDRTRISMEEVFAFYFSRKNEMGPDGKFARFTQAEQEAVRGAVIVPGMRREAVLMAYGYPARDRTASLDNDVWVFRHMNFYSRSVRFKNGRTLGGLF